MPTIKLTSAEREELKKLVRYGEDRKVSLRARALLALDEGGKPTRVAESFGVSRSTVYEWLQRYRQANGEALRLRLRDQPRPGRPQIKITKVKTLLPSLLKSDPRTLGYLSSEWTNSLLQEHFEKRHQLEVSRETIRRALIQLND